MCKERYSVCKIIDNDISVTFQEGTSMRKWYICYRKNKFHQNNFVLHNKLNINVKHEYIGPVLLTFDDWRQSQLLAEMNLHVFSSAPLWINFVPSDLRMSSS